jgi:hypothetical protein
MATYKVTYILDGKKWERYVDNVISSAEAVDVCDMNNPEIPKEAFVQVQLICE